MKKYVAILLCLSVLLIGLVACKNNNDTEEESTDTVDITDVSETDEAEEEEEEDPDVTEPNFDDEDDTDGKIQADGGNIGTPGGSGAGGNWTNPY